MFNYSILILTKCLKLVWIAPYLFISVTHMMKYPRPFPAMFLYYKHSNNGWLDGWEHGYITMIYWLLHTASWRLVSRSWIHSPRWYSYYRYHNTVIYNNHFSEGLKSVLPISPTRFVYSFTPSYVSRVQHNLSWWVHCVWWLLWLWADGYLFGGNSLPKWRHMLHCKGTQWLQVWLSWGDRRSEMWRRYVLVEVSVYH